MSEKRKTNILRAYWIALFAVLLLFFTRMHPMTLFDLDDWLYVSEDRAPIPLWGSWNPAKVLPEILFPFCGKIAAFAVYPIVKDYIWSVAIVCGLVYSACVWGYALAVSKLLEKKIGISGAVSTALATAFLAFHFLIFYQGVSHNDYLFGAQNVNCVFNYTIPTLLNVWMLIFLELHPEWMRKEEGHGRFAKSLFFLSLYFLIFSNLYSSWVLAVWAGVRLIRNIVGRVSVPKGKESGRRGAAIRQFLSQNATLVLIEVLWMVSAIFEYSGGRAKRASEESFLFALKDTVKNLISYFVENIWLGFALVGVLCTIAIVVVLWRQREERGFVLRLYGQIISNFVLGLIFLILLCTKVEPGYITRPEVLIGAMFWLFLGMVAALAYVCKHKPVLNYALLVLTLYLSWNVYANDGNFMEFNSEQLSWKAAYEIGTAFIEQYVEAEAAGEQEVEIRVPQSLSENNWPIPAKWIYRVGTTLYRHCVISEPIKGIGVEDDSLY